MKFSIGVLYKNLWSNHELCENHLSNTHALLKGINKLLPYFTYFLANLSET